MAAHFWFLVLQLSLALIFLVHTSESDPSGFTSIDCGFLDKASYNDEITNITYNSDSGSIDTGINCSISSEYKTKSLDRQFWYVRSFPEANRNCCALDNPFQGNGTAQHLIRARFMYGNYDHKNSPPKFDLYLGSTFWDSVEFESASSIVTKEIIYTPMFDDHISVCLCNINKGTPFISVLERRVLNDYGFGFSMVGVVARFNLGFEDGKIVRYPDDVYDRIWTPYNSVDLNHINTSRPIQENDLPYSIFFIPSIVMETAATPANVSDNIRLSFRPRYSASTYFAFLYFAEIQKLRKNQSREFRIFVGGNRWGVEEPLRPDYLQLQVSATEILEAVGPKRGWDVWINRTSGSTLPPLLNAIEMFTVKDVTPSQTDQNDYDAIKNIRQQYRIKRNWQGDPCTPRPYMWEGLNCSNNGSESDPYRITYLNLSSSRLTGNIARWISDLGHLKHLDLSNNKLTGTVPSLSQLQYLTFLNIEGNELSGTIPPEFIERNNETFQLRYGGNRNLCYPGRCKERHKDKVVIAVAASFGGAFIIVVAAIIFSIFKRRQKVDTNPNKRSFYSNISKRLMLLSDIKKKLKSNKQLTYAEILSITKNFEKVVGKGGFGTVYHGHFGNIQVAVKMISPSTQGFLQFQAEANLLTRVHHKCLTPLVGYCHEGTNIALIYEYMPNGDLAKNLSDSEKLLSWKQRIQIAVDAAEGLDYLHSGCKPPIVHRDIKSRNILPNEKLQGKIADFGLSKIFPDDGQTHVFTVIAGTPGYLDPEYYVSNRLNEKSDVLSFGVVLLELITGRPAITKTEEKAHVIQWVGSMLLEREINDIVDSRLQGEFNTDSARKALNTAMACVAPKSISRPNMSQVVVELKQCLGTEMTQESGSNGCTSNSFAESDSNCTTPNRSIYVSNSTDSIREQSSLLM